MRSVMKGIMRGVITCGARYEGRYKAHYEGRQNRSKRLKRHRKLWNLHLKVNSKIIQNIVLKIVGVQSRRKCRP
jgi:hypothetical protein